MAIQNYTRQLTTVIMDLVQPEVETFDPPTRKSYPRIKHEADRMTRWRDMAVRIFPKCEVGRSLVVGRLGPRSARSKNAVSRAQITSMAPKMLTENH